MAGCYYVNLESKARCQGANRGTCSRCGNPYCESHSPYKSGVCNKCMWGYDDPRDLSLSGYKRFYPFKPIFPLSISFPDTWQASFHDKPDVIDSIFVDFGPSSSWLVSVVRLDYSSEGYNFKQVNALSEQMERDVARLYSRTTNIPADAVRHWIEWPGGKSSGLKRLFSSDERPDYLRGPAFVSDMAIPFPRIVYQDKQGQFGEHIYFLRNSDTRSVIWKLLRQPGSDVRQEVFQTMLRSVRWLSYEFFEMYG